jgi:hypothetical protein
MKKTLLFLLIFTVGGALFAQQRHALVIGNHNYADVPKLENPIKDATAIAAKLRTLGYQVDLQTNLTNVAMARAISNFTQKLAQNRDNEGFFWFAGHGVQMSGENYLLPIDVDVTNEVEAVHSSYSVKRLVDSLDQVARNKVNVVVLDACRNNPFANMKSSFREITRGLSVIQNLPSDLLVIYSTAAGDVAIDSTKGDNSPFTQAFLTNIDRNDDIQIVFRSIARETMRLTNNKQRPFHDGSFLNLDFYSLNPRRTGPVSTTGSITITSQIAGEILIDVKGTGITVKEGGTVTVNNISTGNTEVAVKQSNGTITKATNKVMVRAGQIASAVIERPAPAVPPQRQTYNIGDRGPAGGIIFYDKGNNSDGWRYMEAAPVDLRGVEWGLFGEGVSGTGTGIGSGKRNTELIIVALNRKGESGRAAQLCRAYTLNGYSDWFLPSKDELNVMYQNLKQKGLGGFSNNWYWSSSQSIGSNSWLQDFSSGNQYSNYKYNTSTVRAVRAF